MLNRTQSLLVTVSVVVIGLVLSFSVLYWGGVTQILLKF